MTQIISVGSYRRAVGKSLIAANQAAQASLLGWRVGIAELNYLYPFFHISVFDIPNTAGSLADLLEKPAFLRKNQESAETIARETRGIAVIVGAVWISKRNSLRLIITSWSKPRFENCHPRSEFRSCCTTWMA